MPGSKNPPPKLKTSTEKKTDAPRKTNSEKRNSKDDPEVKAVGAEGAQKGGKVVSSVRKDDGEKPSRDVVERNTTKLFQAIRRAQTRNMQEFIRLGANVNGRDEEGRTPIILAAELRNNTVQTLLCAKHVIDVNASDKLRRTALHYESAPGDTDSVKQLLAHGANIDTRDVAGRTPLHFAVNGNHFATADILVFCGADGTLKDKNRVSPESLSTTPMMTELMKRSREITTGIKHEYITIARTALTSNCLVELDSIGLKVETPEMFSKSSVCFLCRRVRPEYSLTCLGPINSELLISDTFEFRISGSQFKGKVKVYIPMYDKPEPYEEVHIKTNITHTLREDSVELTDYERLENSNKWICCVDIDLKEIDAFVLVTRPRVEYFNVGSRGGQFVSEVDDFIKFDIPPESFSNKGSLSLELIPRPAYENDDLELETIEVDSVSNFYDVNHTLKEQPQNDVTVTLPLPRDYTGDSGDLYVLNRRDEEEGESDLSLWEIICVNPRVTQGKITFEASHFCSYGMVSTRQPRCDTEISDQTKKSAAVRDFPNANVDTRPGTRHEPEDKPQDSSCGGEKQSNTEMPIERGAPEEDVTNDASTDCQPKQDTSKQDTSSVMGDISETNDREALQDEEKLRKGDDAPVDDNKSEEIGPASAGVLPKEASTTGKLQIKTDTDEHEQDAGGINRQMNDLDRDGDSRGNNIDMKEPSRSDDVGLATENDTDNKSIKSVTTEEKLKDTDDAESQAQSEVASDEKTTHPGGSTGKVASDEETTHPGGSTGKVASDEETTHPGGSTGKVASDEETTHPGESTGKVASNEETNHPGGSTGKVASDEETTHPGGSTGKVASDEETTHPGESTGKVASNEETTHPGESTGKVASNEETTHPGGSTGKVASDEETTHPGGSTGKVASDEETTHPGGSTGKVASNEETNHPGGSTGKVASDEETTHPGGSTGKAASDKETTHPGGSPGKVALNEEERILVEKKHPVGSVGKVASEKKEEIPVETTHSEKLPGKEEVLNDTDSHHSKAGSTTSVYKERSGFHEKQVGKTEYSAESKPVDPRREGLSSNRSGKVEQFESNDKNITSKNRASDSSLKGSQMSIAGSDKSVHSAQSKRSIHSQRTISRKEQYMSPRNRHGRVSKISSRRSSAQGSSLEVKESKKQQKERWKQETEVKKVAAALYDKAKKRTCKVSFVVMLRANETDNYETLVECTMKDPDKRVTYWKTEGFDDQKPSYPPGRNEYNIIPKTLFTFPISGAAECFGKSKLEFHPKRKDDNVLIFSIRRVNPDNSQSVVSIRKMMDRRTDNAEEESLGQVILYLDGYDGKNKKSLKDAKHDSSFKGFTSDTFLEKIAKHLTSEWYKLGIHLGLAKSIIDNSDEVKGDKKLMMLILWRDICRYRRDMGVGNLTMALRRVGRDDIEEFVMQELKTWKETNKTRDDSFCTWLRAALTEDWIIPKGDLEPLSVAFMMSLVDHVGMETTLVQRLDLPTPQINNIEEDKRFFPTPDRKMLEMLLQAKMRYQSDIVFFEDLDRCLGELGFTEAQEWCRNTTAEWCWENGDNGGFAFVEQLKSYLDEVGHQYPPVEQVVDVDADAVADAPGAAPEIEEQVSQ